MYKQELESFVLDFFLVLDILFYLLVFNFLQGDPSSNTKFLSNTLLSIELIRNFPVIVLSLIVVIILKSLVYLCLIHFPFSQFLSSQVKGLYLSFLFSIAFCISCKVAYL